MAAILIISPAFALLKTHYVSISFLFVTLYLLKTKYLTPLRKIPGPWFASISKGWFIFHGLRGEQHLVHIKTHEKYGPIFRAMPNYVLVNDPKYLQKVYKYDRTHWYDAFNVSTDYNGVASTLSMDAHNWKRKRIGAAVGQILVFTRLLSSF
jgi:hypothetical protein